MTDYQSQLIFFSDQAGRRAVEDFFVKYWLDQPEYFGKWKQIQDAVFDAKAITLADQIFNPGFLIFPNAGGSTFSSQEEFRSIQSCMQAVGDEYFLVLQNPQVEHRTYIEGQWLVEPILQFRFPVDIAWSELISGGSISNELFETSNKDFYVFGDSAKWGRYVSPEFLHEKKRELPVELSVTAFAPEYSGLFVTALGNSPDPGILEVLPEHYKKMLVF